MVNIHPYTRTHSNTPTDIQSYTLTQIQIFTPSRTHTDTQNVSKFVKMPLQLFTPTTPNQKNTTAVENDTFRRLVAPWGCLIRLPEVDEPKRRMVSGRLITPNSLMSFIFYSYLGYANLILYCFFTGFYDVWRVSVCVSLSLCVSLCLCVCGCL